MESIEVKGAVLFVTGANRSRGIGRAIVLEAVSRGAKKVYATSRDLSQLDELVALHPERIVPVHLDLADPKSIQAAAELAADTEILVNNSGFAGYSGFCFNYDDEVARRELEVNYFGPLYLSQAFASSLIGRPSSAIINILSIASLSSFPLAGTYSASKAAAHSLTQCLRAEMHAHGVAVFGVYPGPIDTDMADGVDMEKASPASVAVRLFDGVAEGKEWISVDSFSDDFVARFLENPLELERDRGPFVHGAPEV